MLSVASLTLPFFALIFLGTYLRRSRFLDVKATALLAKFAFYVLMPPLVFTKIASVPAAQIWNPGFLIRYESVTLLLFLLAFPLGAMLGQNLKTRGVLGLNLAYPNYGYIGIPMSLMAFGDQAALPLALLLFADTLVMLSAATIYVALGSGEGSISASLAMIPRTLFGNPLIMAAILGILASLIGLRFPAPIQSLLDMLANAAPSVALVALGASLSIGVLTQRKTEMTIISLVKLLVHPLLVATAFVLWPGQEKVWQQTAILCASLPVAANVFMLAGHYGTYQARSATAIMVTTVLSTISVPLTLYLLYNWLD